MHAFSYHDHFIINKGNSSIPLFEIHKSIEKKTNPSYKLKLRETHQI